MLVVYGAANQRPTDGLGNMDQEAGCSLVLHGYTTVQQPSTNYLSFGPHTAFACVPLSYVQFEALARSSVFLLIDDSRARGELTKVTSRMESTQFTTVRGRKSLFFVSCVK